jgi:hypothetical protein
MLYRAAYRCKGCRRLAGTHQPADCSLALAFTKRPSCRAMGMRRRWPVSTRVAHYLVSPLPVPQRAEHEVWNLACHLCSRNLATHQGLMLSLPAVPVLKMATAEVAPGRSEIPLLMGVGGASGTRGYGAARDETSGLRSADRVLMRAITNNSIPQTTVFPICLG